MLIHLVNVSVESECPGPENRPLKCRLCQLNFRAETPVANTARAAKLISSVLTRLLVQQPLRHMELSNAPFMSVASTCWQHWDHKIREEGESLEFATWILPEIVFRLSDWDFGIMRCWDQGRVRSGKYVPDPDRIAAWTNRSQHKVPANQGHDGWARCRFRQFATTLTTEKV